VASPTRLPAGVDTWVTGPKAAISCAVMTTVDRLWPDLGAVDEGTESGRGGGGRVAWPGASRPAAMVQAGAQGAGGGRLERSWNAGPSRSGGGSGALRAPCADGMYIQVVVKSKKRTRRWPNQIDSPRGPEARNPTANSAIRHPDICPARDRRTSFDQVAKAIGLTRGAVYEPSEQAPTSMDAR